MKFCLPSLPMPELPRVQVAWVCTLSCTLLSYFHSMPSAGMTKTSLCEKHSRAVSKKSMKHYTLLSSLSFILQSYNLLPVQAQTAFLW